MTREYEHLAVALTVVEGGRGRASCPCRTPRGWPSTRPAAVVYLASTRNPNQLYELEPVTALVEGGGGGGAVPAGNPLVPTRSAFLPGSLYLHDLALHRRNALRERRRTQRRGRARGRRALAARLVAALDRAGRRPRLLTQLPPAQLDRRRTDARSLVLLRLGGGDLGTAPGPPQLPGRRARGDLLGRDARAGRDRADAAALGAPPRGGALGRQQRLRRARPRIDGDRASVVSVLPGWTRGLWLGDGLAFVGSSRVLPRFRAYAPGLEVEASECGVHVVELASGAILGSLLWPAGNQIFAIEAVPASLTAGFPSVLLQF